VIPNSKFQPKENNFVFLEDLFLTFTLEKLQLNIGTEKRKHFQISVVKFSIDTFLSMTNLHQILYRPLHQLREGI